MNKIDNIKILYEQITQKGKFVELVSKEVGKAFGTVNTHYFKGGWSIPEDEQDRIIELAQNTIRNQIEKMQNVLIDDRG